MEPRLIIGLVGAPRAGKDTAAAHLCKYGYTRYAFADPIYAYLAVSFGVSADLLKSHEYKTTPQESLALLKCEDSSLRAFAHAQGMDLWQPRTSRELARLYGQEFIDYRHGPRNGLLAKMICSQILAEGQKRIVVSDLRQMTEFTHLLELTSGGNRMIIVHVSRPGVEESTYKSERPVKDIWIDHRVVNDGLPEELGTRILAIAAKEGFK